MKSMSFSQTLAGLAFFMGVQGMACAGSFAVSPVRATLTVGHTAEALTVRNQGDESAVVQLELQGWAQDAAGKDVFSPTRDVLATPPIFTVPPGGKQIVRLGLRRPASGQAELTYRLFLQEVPPPPKPGFQGLQMALRLSVPVFVKPATPVAHKLNWRLRREATGKLRLAATNDGNAHVQLINFSLAPANGKPLPPQEAATYMLPGQHREWDVQVEGAPSPGLGFHLHAQTDAGEIDADLVVDKP